MPATSVMTTSESHVARQKATSEPLHQHSTQRVHRPDPDLPGPAIALITTGGHTGCPLTTAEELGIRVSGWVHCEDLGGADRHSAAPSSGPANPTFAETVESFAHADGIGAIAA